MAGEKNSKGKGKGKGKGKKAQRASPMLSDDIFSGNVYRPTFDYPGPNPFVGMSPIETPTFDDFDIPSPAPYFSSQSSHVSDSFINMLDQTQLHGDTHTDPEEYPCTNPPVTSPAKTPPVTPQMVKWSWAEDEVLITSWIHVSTDATVGTDQSGACFWAKVYSLCTSSLRGIFFANRSTAAVKKHFLDMNKKLKIYGGYYAQAAQRHASGANEEDWEKEATRNYEMMHCRWNLHQQWNMLKNQPAWVTYSSDTKSVAYATRKPGRSDSSSSGKRSRNEETSSFPPRPVGRDAAKRAAASSRSQGKGKEALVEQQIAASIQSNKDRELAARRKDVVKQINHQESLVVEHVKALLNVRALRKEDRTPEERSIDTMIVDTTQKSLTIANNTLDELRVELAKLASLESMPIDSDSE